MISAEVEPPEAQEALKDTQINVYNFRQMRSLPPSTMDIIRFDPNNTCNLRCVYCHNGRSDDVIDFDDFRSFLNRNVLSSKFFQVGCIMEPTLDARLADILLAIADSPAKPAGEFMLQTNGTLLHRHDVGKIRASGLTTLSVSVDAAEPGTQKELRNGTSLDKVVRNVASFREALPDVNVTFIATITTANVGKMRDLVSLGMGLGVGMFIFREVFYHPESDVVDHTRMPGLLLQGEQFQLMRDDLLAEFGNRANFLFADEKTLNESAEKMKRDSMRT